MLPPPAHRLPLRLEHPPVTLAEIYQQNPFVLSYELFPPKTDEGMAALRDHLEKLLEFKPHFITCTYGAGGSTRDRTLETLGLVRELCDLPVASHLTCVGATREDLRAYLAKAKDSGVGFIVALRGDPPRGDATFKPALGGFAYGNELVSFIRGEHPDFGIAVAGYPEKHPEASTPEGDLAALKRKVDAGADVVITQMFYNNETFYRWRDRCIAAGIDVPIVPGILPIINYKQIQRISSLCGATLPKTLTDELERCGDDAEAQLTAGVQYATRQVQDLIDTGIPGIHFYVLNQSRATAHVLSHVRLPSAAARES